MTRPPRAAVAVLVALFCVAGAGLTGCGAGAGDTPGNDSGAASDAMSMSDATSMSDAEATDAGSLTPDASTTVDAGPGPAPALGVQIDRAGRALVNFALAAPFPTSGTTGPQTAAQLAAEDQYNAASDIATFSSFIPAFVDNLKRWDGLNSTCGDSFLVGAAGTTRYTALATMFVDDRLYSDTRQGTCATYLALERNGAGATFQDCGGRTPLVDAIDATYTAIISGFAGAPVPDGVARDQSGAASTTSFPFLVTPN